MATRSDLPRLQGSKPTLFNTTASLLGLLAGGAAYGAAAYFGPAAVTLGAVTLAAPLAAAAAVGAVGAIIGGMFGKARMTQELRSGVAVSEPRFLNKGLVNGLFIGAATVLGVLAAPAILGAAAVPAWLGGTTVLAAIAAVPAVLGSLVVRSSQARIYTLASHEADAITVSRQGDQARAKGLEHYLQAPKTAAKDTVTKEESAALETRQNAGRGGQAQSFVDRVTAARSVADQSLAK